jgi:hypothetical protein
MHIPGTPKTVRAELAEAPPFSSPLQREEQSFDKLRANGI